MDENVGHYSSPAPLLLRARNIMEDSLTEGIHYITNAEQLTQLFFFNVASIYTVRYIY